jgi:hypothetical protein
MRAGLWTLVVAAVGAGVLLRGAGQATPATNTTNSTQAAESVLAITAPFVGQLLLVAGLGAVILLAIRAT